MNENIAESKPLNFLKTVVPLLLGWGFTLIWAFRIFTLQHQLILNDSALDLSVIALIVLAGLFRKRFSGFLPAFCLLSYEIHAQSAMRVENFQFFYIVSWMVCTYLLYRHPERAGSLTLYHAGLSFDPGSAVTMGVGMQAGLSAAPVTTLFLAFFSRELWNNRINFAADSRHFLAVAGLSWLAVNHYRGMAADITAQFIAVSSAMLLFWATCAVASDPREQQRHINAIAAGGVLIVAAAICNQAMESATFGEFFSRRAWAGSLHPNHLATWCLAAIWALVAGQKAYPQLHQNRRLMFSAFFLLMTLISGARIIIAITVVCLLLHFLLSGKDAKPAKEKVVSAPDSLRTRRLAAAIIVILILAFVSGRLFYKFDPLELARNERLFIWKAATQLISAAPFTGYGVLQFAMLPQYVSKEAAVWVYDWNYPHTHQGLLEILLWGGLPLLVIFLISWLRALSIWKSSGLAIAFLAVSTTIIADFTWRTPAMILLAFFFLLPKGKAAFAAQNFSFFIKSALSLPLIAVVFWLMQLHSGFISYNQALAFLTTRNGPWKPAISNAVNHLPFSVDAQMQRLLWKLSRERIDDEFETQLSQLRSTFPTFWPALYIEARKLELAGDLHTALQIYAETLAFERADLGGIRHARAALLAFRLNDNRLNEFTEETFARGGWGAAMLANHPEHGSSFKALALKIARNSKPEDFFAAVKLARIVKNLADNGVMADEFLPELTSAGLPAWLYDEVVGAVGLVKAKTIAARYEKVDFSETGQLKPRLLSPADRATIDALAEELRLHGSSSLRTLAWIRLEQADHGGFIAAYDQMLQRYNFRSKNYEDLAGQYAFARFAFLSGDYLQALEMLQKLASFDAGCPFISKLLAQCYLTLEKPQQASFYVNLARKQVEFARLDPFYREEPRNILWPQGDQWIFLFEKVLRRSDPEARKYCESDWQKFIADLEPSP